MTFIYETYDTVSQSGFIDFREKIPSYIIQNLKHPLRPYQEEAIGRYLYYKTDKNHTIPEQVLYNMATGSGKTLLMAAVILEKYKQGERNFIFFVNNDNILTKTRDNFLENSSGKYLFTDKIVIDNQNVNIREVTDFSDSRDDSINIVFTTIQRLHLDLNTPRENRLSYEQFKDISVVMLADEAHHLNAGLSKSEKDDNTSWTNTIETIQKTAQKSSIFEFTATIDLSNPTLAQKYEKSLLFKYDLKEFRLDKYSKDVLFHLVDGSVNNRMLQAILISQFRKKIALKNGINLKPLVMFKSQKISESQGNLHSFLELLDHLTVEDIQNQRRLVSETEEQNNILKKALEYFETAGISDTDLISELQEDFRQERLLLVDGKNKNKNSLSLLNTLEQAENEIRAIFAVDMLNEGWDVLNLFDIVRLYDIRDGKTTKNGFVAGKTTNTEKQLIGRGARYYPFVIGNNVEEKYTRKFDENENNELRVIEQLHYHSANNPRYISELKQVLRESGIYDDQELEERQLKLKESFKKTRTYTDGVVWMNKRLSYQELAEGRQESLFDTSFIPKSFEVVLPSQGVHDIDAFDESLYISEPLASVSFKFGREIGNNIVRAAINRNKLSLEAPEQLWNSLAKDYRNRAGIWTCIFIVAVVLLILASVQLVLAIHNYSMDVIKEIPFISESFIFVSVISFFIYIIRILIKIVMSNHHLAVEYKQKASLTRFYQALIKSGTNIDKEERLIIINSLFSRVDTGLVKTDTSNDNDSIWAILSKNLK